MAPFDELQQLWQRQPELPTAQIADVHRSLHAYGRRQNWITTGKAVVIAVMMSFSGYHVRNSLVSVAGIALVTITAALLIARDWRTQRAIASTDFSAPSVGFVGAAIDRLLEQRNVRRSYYWSLLGACILGENLILMGTQKIWPRIVASLAPFAALEFGLWVRRRRFDYECRPLLDQLRAAKAALEDRA